jgi:phage tail sheath gpL-like
MITEIEITTDETAADVAEKLATAKGDPKRLANELVTYFNKMAGGLVPANVKVKIGDVKATGTVTLASVDVDDTVTIDGVTFTAVASGATGAQFNQGGTDTADAASLVTAINANTTLDGRVVATSALGVVTITAIEAGELGNSVTLASSNGTRLAVSAAALAGGVNGTTTSFAFGRVAS